MTDDFTVLPANEAQWEDLHHPTLRRLVMRIDFTGDASP
jgi:hypothetical protein